MSYVGIHLGNFVTGKLTESAVLEGISVIPDILKDLTMNRENVDKLCYSAYVGALSAPEARKIVGDSYLSCVATGIEMAMFPDGPTRLKQGSGH